MDQLDIFVHAPRQPARPQPAAPIAAIGLRALLPVRPVAWGKLLAILGDPAPILMVSALWTGAVVEVATDHANRRRVTLCRDEISFDVHYDAGAPARVIYLTIEAARAIHARCPLLRLGGGTHGIRLREPLPGEAPTIDPFDGIVVAEVCEHG